MRTGRLNQNTMMNATEILWTLEMLDWINDQLFHGWPEVKLRGSAPDVDPEPYRVRFRDDEREYWLTFCPKTMSHTSVADVRDLLEKEDWIRRIQTKGLLEVELCRETGTRPVLVN